jgi:hypothetical protein
MSKFNIGQSVTWDGTGGVPVGAVRGSGFPQVVQITSLEGPDGRVTYGFAAKLRPDDGHEGLQSAEMVGVPESALKANE